jgi:outer membrane protein assembly factor BamB
MSRRTRRAYLTTRLRALAIGLALVAASAAAIASAVRAAELDRDTWPQWRGPAGAGIAASADVPLEWDAASGKNVLWKTPIEGRGHSSPVVWGDRIFLTTAIEGDVIPGAKAPPHIIEGEEFKHPQALGSDRHHTLRVIALDAASGSVVWSKTVYEGAMFDDRHQVSSYASPTVATDGERVYAYFGSQGIHVFDFAGNPVWNRDVGDIKTLGMGVGTSPVLAGDLVFLQADENEGKESFLVALDKKSGNEAWRRARPVQASWTTPIVVAGADGVEQLVTAGNEHVIAYEPATGRELWRVEGLVSNAIHVPLYANGMLYVTAGYPQKVLKAFELGPAGQAPRLAWSYNKGMAYVPSNLLYDGRLYLIADNGLMTCLDAKTGDLVYEGGRAPAQGTYVASLVAVDGKILMVNRDGDAGWIKAGPQHEVIAQASVDEPVYATPAIAGDRIYVRGERHLFAIGKSAS